MSLKKLGAGLVIAALVACVVTPVAVAATPAKIWKSQPQDFRLGYLIGFFDAANIARGISPHGYIDKNFPRIDGIGPNEWEMAIRDVYKDPDYADANVIRALVKAGANLGGNHVVLDGFERSRRKWMRSKGGSEPLARLDEQKRRNAVAQLVARTITGPASADKAKKQAKVESKPATPQEEARAKLRTFRRKKTKERDQDWLKEAKRILSEQGMLGPEDE